MRKLGYVGFFFLSSLNFALAQTRYDPIESEFEAGGGGSDTFVITGIGFVDAILSMVIWILIIWGGVVLVLRVFAGLISFFTDQK